MPRSPRISSISLRFLVLRVARTKMGGIFRSWKNHPLRNAIQSLLLNLGLNRAWDHVTYAASLGNALADIAAGDRNQGRLDNLIAQRKIIVQLQRGLQFLR